MLDLTTILFLLFNLYIIAFIILIILDNRDPRSTIAWILITILLPAVGLLLYLIFGRNWRKLSKRKKLVRQELSKHLVGAISALERKEKENIKFLLEHEEYKNKAELVNLLKNNSGSILTISNQVEVLQSGQEKFTKLIADISRAKNFIHLEYYIWKNLSLIHI